MMFQSCYKINTSYLFSNIILSTASGQLMHLLKKKNGLSSPFSRCRSSPVCGWCLSEWLHPRGLKATRSTVADSGDRLVKLRGGVFFKALTQPIALRATIRGGSPHQQAACAAILMERKSLAALLRLCYTLRSFMFHRQCSISWNAIE